MNKLHYQIIAFYHKEQIVSILPVYLPQLIINRWVEENGPNYINSRIHNYFNVLSYNHLMLLSKSHEGTLHSNIIFSTI
jgi:hypothetical protein